MSNCSCGRPRYSGIACPCMWNAEEFGAEGGGAYLVCTECFADTDLQTDGWLIMSLGHGAKVYCPEHRGDESGGVHLECTEIDSDGQSCYQSTDLNHKGWLLWSGGQGRSEVYCPEHGEEAYPDYYAEEFGVEYVGRRPCYTYSEVTDTIRALHDAEKINYGVASPSYGKYVGWLPSRLAGEDVLSGGSMEDSYYQPSFHIGDWGYGRHTKTPMDWFNEIKAGLDGDTINVYGRTDVQLFEDGWYESSESEPDNYGAEYSDGIECPCGAKDMIALSSGSVHSCTYHAGEILGMAQYDRKVIMNELKKSFGAEEFQADSPVEELKELDVVKTTQRVVGKTGLNIPTGVASLAILWIAFMTGKRYSN